MDTVVGILSSLGVNNTFFIQLVLFMIVFLFLWKVGFTPYFEAFELREEKTKGSEDFANKLSKDTEKTRI